VIELARSIALLALVSLPLIVLLHSLRPRRRSVELSTTRLWREALRERRRGFGLRKLLRNLNLLLLLLAALLLSVGLAEPRWLTRSAEPDDVVLVLDVSASMKARDGRGTRFELALREAARVVDDLPSGSRVLVMTSGRSPVIRSTFAREAASLRATLSGLRPTDEAGRPREALNLAFSLLRNRERGRIVFVTDGAFESDSDFGASRVEYRTVGESGRNVAITRFELRREVGTEERFQVLLTVRNYTTQTVRVPTSVTLEGERLLEHAIVLAPHAKETFVRAFRGAAAGRARASITFDDDLATDNQAYAVLGSDEPLRVLLFTEGNLYLESAFQAMHNVAVSTSRAVQPERLAGQARRYDLVVFDGVPAPRLPPGRYLLVASVPPGLPFAGAGFVDRPTIEGRGTSVLVRQVDLSAVKIDRARRVTLDSEAPGLQRLFWSKETALGLAWLTRDVRVVYLGFELAGSNFPLQAAFPLFLAESLAWLRPRASRFAPTQIPTGARYTMTVPAHQADLIVRTPAGDGMVYDTPGGSLLFDATADAGIYRYTVGGVHRYLAVNLTDERESDIRPRGEIGPDPASPIPVEAPSRVVIELWRTLALLALAGLAIEAVLGWLGRLAGTRSPADTGSATRPGSPDEPAAGVGRHPLA
jgi:hypothetical protein